MTERPLRIMVLAGGPDGEREISLASGACVADALATSGHTVCNRDATPDDLSALDDWAQWRGDLVFPVMHGPWGEGGVLQGLLEQRGIPYVGSDAAASADCMAKDRAKQILISHGLPTPPFVVFTNGQPPEFDLPAVLKPVAEGSSIDIAICKTASQVSAAAASLGPRHDRLMIEQFIEGQELTVGVVADPRGDQALPPIMIRPMQGVFDFKAKYVLDDTEYLADRNQMGITEEQLVQIKTLALESHKVLGCRELSRVDLMLDHQGQPWILEVNTLPGFTSHSLLPKAAGHVGISIPELVDQIAQAAFNRAAR